MITLVVFSKDRALQCDSLLHSVKDHCTGIDEVMVIAWASSKLHEDAYWEMANDENTPYAELRMQVGTPIGKLIEELTFGSQHVALAVDDQVFYAPSDFRTASELLDHEEGFVWSWRLGVEPGMRGKTYGSGKLVAHAWVVSALATDPDYSYLFHSDGALYRTEDYLAKLDRCLPDWRTGSYTPNDLEAAVAARRKIWAPLVGPHLGPLSPTCITWQVNRVQTKYGSPAAEIPETNVDALAKAYLAGKRVDNAALYAGAAGILSDHPVPWTKRYNPPGARPTHVYACEEASKFYASLIR